MHEDQEWVNQVLNGNKQAYAHLIHKYKDRIYAFLLRMVRHPQDAQDLTQECFIKAYRYLHSYDPQRSLPSWLYRIAVNLYVDAKPASQRQQNLLEVDELMLMDDHSPETIYLKYEDLEVAVSNRTAPRDVSDCTHVAVSGGSDVSRDERNSGYFHPDPSGAFAPGQTKASGALSA